MLLDKTRMPVKIVLIGDSGVGAKTSLIISFCDHFRTGLMSTIGGSFYTKKITVDGREFDLELWGLLILCISQLCKRGFSSQVLCSSLHHS